MTAPMLSKGDLIQVVDSRHPALKGKQVTVDGIIVRGADSDGIVDSVAAVETVAASTFTPKPGQQVRVVKCLGAQCHDGQVGTFLHELSGEWIVSLADGLVCAAIEVAPVWQPGEVVTEEMGEPPTGSVVKFRVSSGCYWRRPEFWLPLDADGAVHQTLPPETWGNLRMRSARGRMDIILVSLPGRDVVTTEPTNITTEVIDRNGDVYRRIFFSPGGCNWRRLSTEAAMDWSEILERGPIHTFERPKSDQATEEPKPIDVPEPEGVGTVVEVAYPDGSTHLFTRIAASGMLTQSIRWAASTMPVPKAWELVRAGAVSIKVVEPAPPPQPQTREVPLSEARPGDAGTIGFHVLENDGLRVTLALETSIFDVDRDGQIIISPELLDCAVMVRRAQNPLPTTPGAVGTATIRGDVRDVRVYRIPDGSDRPWVTFLGGVQARHTSDQITDFVELLPGEGR